MSTSQTLTILVLLSPVIFADTMKWTDPVSGAKYDWQALQRPDNSPWVIEDNADFLIGEKLVFNFGKPVVNQCAPGTVVEVTDIFGGIFEECMTAGMHEQTTVSALSKNDPNRGVRITYAGGTDCIDETSTLVTPKSTTFRLHCNDDSVSTKRDDTNFAFFRGQEELNYCNIELTMRTKFGCPVSYGVGLNLSWGWILLIGFGTLVLGYFIIGFAYNKCKQGKEGVEAIPHVEIWMEFAELVQEGCAYSSSTLKRIFKRGNSDEGFENL